MTENPLDRDFDAFSLLRFAAPSIFMMIFMGLYTIVDTVFVARYVGSDALAAINIVCPVVNLTVGLASMLGAGGNAVISRKLGCGRQTEAKQNFTLLLLAGLALGVLLAALGLAFIEPLLRGLGASGKLFPYCRDYLSILLLLLPASIMQCLFQNLFATAGKPGLGLALSLLAGCANVLFDYLFIAIMQMGIAGAGLGTGLGYLIPAVAGAAFFAKGQGALSIVKPRWDFKLIAESCLNGSSEMVGQLASAVTTFLFNTAMMGWLGEDGVAAITIIIYSQFLLNTLFFGYGIGVAPVIGFNYGSGNRARQKRVFKASKGFILVVSAAVFLASYAGGPAIAGMFSKSDARVYGIAVEGFSIFAFSFLFCGFNIFTSSMFTALSNGRVSALLSFLRTLGFVAMGILLLPKALGIDGIWLAVPLAEFTMVFVSVGCLLKYRNMYGYC